MRTVIAVAGRVFLDCRWPHFEDGRQLGAGTWQNRRTVKLFQPNGLGRSGRHRLMIEVECRFMAGAGRGRGLGGLSTRRCVSDRLRGVLRVAVAATIARCEAGFDWLDRCYVAY